jgi:hypothetical protein
VKKAILAFLLKVVTEKVRTEIAKVEAIQTMLEAQRKEVDTVIYDFYRCVGCKGVFTRWRELQAFDSESELAGTICSCGSLRYSPSWPKWYEWIYPRVLWFVLLRYLKVA